MSYMERAKMFMVAVIAMCILAPLSGIFLARVHAAPIWYDGVGIFLGGLGTWRAMAPPSAGIRIRGFRAKRHPSVSRSTPPNA
jgi:hypothetical protein